MATNPRPAGDKISVRISSELVVLNTATGEMFPAAEVKGRYTFPNGRFGFMGQVLMMRLVTADLPKDGLRLALLLADRATKGSNAVYGDFGDRARELGIDASRLSKLLRKLERELIIQRIGTRTILVNPAFHFRGTAREQQEALKVWDENRPYARLKPVVAKTA